MAETVKTGTAPTRQQASLWKLCGCIDAIMLLSKAVLGVTAIAICHTDCSRRPAPVLTKLSTVLRKLLEAIEKALSKERDTKWEEALTIGSSLACPRIEKVVLAVSSPAPPLSLSSLSPPWGHLIQHLQP
jgi:hypothetical protein